MAWKMNSQKYRCGDWRICRFLFSSSNCFHFVLLTYHFSPHIRKCPKTYSHLEMVVFRVPDRWWIFFFTAAQRSNVPFGPFCPSSQQEWNEPTAAAIHFLRHHSEPSTRTVFWAVGCAQLRRAIQHVVPSFLRLNFPFRFPNERRTQRRHVKQKAFNRRFVYSRNTRRCQTYQIWCEPHRTTSTVSHRRVTSSEWLYYCTPQNFCTAWQTLWNCESYRSELCGLCQIHTDTSMMTRRISAPSVIRIAKMILKVRLKWSLSVHIHEKGKKWKCIHTLNGGDGAGSGRASSILKIHSAQWSGNGHIPFCVTFSADERASGRMPHSEISENHETPF